MLQQFSDEGSQLQLCAGEELHYSEICATYPKLVIKNTHWSVSLDNQIIQPVSPAYQLGAHLWANPVENMSYSSIATIIN